MKTPIGFAGLATAALLFAAPAAAQDFSSVDLNGDGVVDADELAAAGIDPGLITSYDATGTGTLDEMEFANLMSDLGIDTGAGGDDWDTDDTYDSWE